MRGLRRLAVSVTLGLLGSAAAPAPPPGSLDAVARAYVVLVLSMQPHDRDYVDAYYGPPAWRAEAEASPRSLAQIRVEAEALLHALAKLPPSQSDEILALRHGYLAQQLQALVARTALLTGVRMTFDEESKALYDAVAPTRSEGEFAPVLAELEAALPGPAPLAERYTAFRDQFTIPKDRVAAVFSAAIAECRKRTLAHVALPPGESFDVEYVTGKSWGAYNWYQGGFKSLIQVNTDLPIGIDRAVDLACHEGYPGHHVYNVLLEQALVRERGFAEFQVYPLFSPQSLIAEGSANFGIDVAFPGAERLAFERDVLYPLAGLPPDRAAAFNRVQALMERLDGASNEVARRFLDGKIDRPQALDWLQHFTLQSPERAQRSLRFIEQYRSYVINYNLGRDMVRAFVEARGGVSSRPEQRWAVFKGLLASPRLPGGLRSGGASSP